MKSSLLRLVRATGFLVFLASRSACGVHAYIQTGNLPHVWKHDGAFSPDPYAYVYRLMGMYYVRPHSQAWIEQTTPLPMVEQMLALLPPDRPHVVIVHLTQFTCGPGQTNALFDYLQQFTTNNPGSRFISAVEIPSLVDQSRNPSVYCTARGRCSTRSASSRATSFPFPT